MGGSCTPPPLLIFFLCGFFVSVCFWFFLFGFFFVGTIGSLQEKHQTFKHWPVNCLSSWMMPKQNFWIVLSVSLKLQSLLALDLT